MNKATPSPDVLIVGAGITGLATALALAEAGASVELLERYAPAAMASGWTLAGVRQSGRDPAELPLARHAVSLWQELDERLGAPTGYRQGGNLRLARNEREAATIRALVSDQRAAGLGIELLEGAAIRDVAPALSPDVALASWCPADGHADPLATIEAYRHAAGRLGVRLASGAHVEGLDVRDGRFRAVRLADGGTRGAQACVLATGIHTGTPLAPLGVELPIRTASVSVLQSAPLEPTLAPVIGVAGADLAVRQQLDGRFRFTGGAEMPHQPLTERDGRPHVPVRAASLAAIIERAAAVLPVLGATPLERFWGGLLDMTPDALPVIDRVPGADGLVVAAGFSGHGFGIGPAVGPCVAALALGHAPPVSLDAFALARFDDGTGRAVGARSAQGASARGAGERVLAEPTLHG